MTAKYILATLAVFFFVLGAGRIGRDEGRIANAGRTWLSLAFIFGVVSVVLFSMD
jgi:hypothetical protein